MDKQLITGVVFIILLAIIITTAFISNEIKKTFNEPNIPVVIDTALTIKESCVDTVRIWEWRKGTTIVLTLPKDSIPYHVAEGIDCDSWPYMVDFNTGITVP